MKTNAAKKRSFDHFHRFVYARRLTIMLVAFVATFGVRRAQAEAINIFDLVLTENSSSSLSLSYNGPTGPSGFSVLNTSPDHWTITVVSNDISFDNFSWDWQEPEEPNEINEVSHFTPNGRANGIFQGDQLFVISDLDFLSDHGGPILPNNTAAPVFVGFEDSSQFGEILLTFNDLAQQNEAGPSVPDTGSALGLLVLSFGALLGLSRRRSLGLA